MAIARKNIKIRLFFVYVIALAVSCAIIWRAFDTAVIEQEGWRKKISRLKIEDRRIDPQRGNIYANDGRLMASSIPQYYIYMDFKADGLKYDTLKHYLPELSQKLSKKFGDKSAAEYSSHIMKGYNSGSRHYRLISRKISYTEMKELYTFPFLKQRSHRSGMVIDEMAQRKKPFGQLASRTIGDVYGDLSKGGKNGLELSMDSLLKGEPGVGTWQKVAGRYYVTPEKEPVNGLDITTTIDIDMQDIVHNALLDKLKDIDAESGTVIVMEVKTGEIKAISNLGRINTGHYGETKNFAVSDESEPGSTFKTLSMMIALDKGIITPNDTIDVGPGYYMYRGAKMTDHNMNHGGYGKITAAQSIWYSSNIGVAKIILKGFEKNPSDFVNAIYETGITKPLDIGIPGIGRAKIRHPKDSLSYWSKTTLPWMSFGYESQVPPIYILNYYNAIANGGKLIKPLLVKNISKDGEVVEKFKTETINSSICSRKTLWQIQQMLLDVVENGTAKMIKSDKLLLAGKTGTAQLSQGALGYKNGGKKHQVSFCGYFPADKPMYSCIVVIRAPRNGYPSGGGMSGMVFKNIAERVYAQGRSVAVEYNEKDSVHTFMPKVKNGNYKGIVGILDKLDLPLEDNKKEWNWAVSSVKDGKITLRELTTDNNEVPSVIGMGAKDAVYLLENRGLRVQINGRGKVYQQSKPAGRKITKGETIVLSLK